MAGIESIETIKASGAEEGFFERWSGYQALVNDASVRFNKTDLYDQGLAELHGELERIYASAGYKVYGTSALRGDGVEEMRDLMSGRTTLFSGHSGVGKSALLNALVPGLELKVGEVSDWSLKGKHTTTFAEMIVVDAGGGVYEQASGGKAPTLLIDTPGIKEFGMVDFSPAELSHFFPEMRAVLPDCHFANCTHRHEPQCAVKQAVEAGTISMERYNNYLGIYDQIVNGE